MPGEQFHADPLHRGCPEHTADPEPLQAADIADPPPAHVPGQAEAGEIADVRDPDLGGVAARQKMAVGQERNRSVHMLAPVRPPGKPLVRVLAGPLDADP
jgi:hypothetical protein